MKARFIGGPAHLKVDPLTRYSYGDPPPLIRKEMVTQGGPRWYDMPRAVVHHHWENYRLIGVRGDVAVYMHEEAALEAAENYGKRRCAACGDMHDASFTFGGVPLLECPAVADLPGSYPVYVVPPGWHRMYAVDWAASTAQQYREGRDRHGTYFVKITRVRSATGETAPADAPAPVLAKKVNEAAREMSKQLSQLMAEEGEHLNRAQRQYIRDVGTVHASADGGKRLAELADADMPESDDSTDSERAAAQAEWVTDLCDLFERGSRRQKKFLEAVDGEPAADTWVCTNHPPGFEITYPASTLKCEVCGEAQP